MSHSIATSISAQDIRQVIVRFLQQRLTDNVKYKSAQTELAKAEQTGDIAAINGAKDSIKELEQRFKLETWMEDAVIRRLSWLTVATHITKGIHPSAKGDNVNYNTQLKPNKTSWISSATIDELPYDSSGAAALDIFGLLNQKIVDNISLLDLVIAEHPALLKGLADDEARATIYLAKFKALLNDNWDSPKTSDLNKQFFWPNSEQTYLSHKENNYRQLVPLHPSSLCHVLYQKVQTRFSDEQKLAREQRKKNSGQQSTYFSFNDLAIVKLGGSNAQNASQLIGSQIGRNFLLPSIPPKFTPSESFKIGLWQKSIFGKAFKYHVRFGLKIFFDMIEASRNTVKERDLRKDALSIILTILLRSAKNIQQTLPAGWSRDYKELDIYQQYWLDPKRADLSGEDNFKQYYQQGDWINEIEMQFADWIQGILKKRFPNIAPHFDDIEKAEWRREIHQAIKASQRNREGVWQV